MIWERAQTLSSDFKIYNLTKPPVLPSILTNKGWEKPPNDHIKINMDAAVQNVCNGLGFIAREHDWFVIRGGYRFIDKQMNMTWAELEAFREGIKLAIRLKMSKLILESDSASLVNTVNNRGKDITILGQQIRQDCNIFLIFFRPK
ncbi:hypothetical protein J1N35_034502 [Gossypium stocksii]|uniref:RNase H type-1 domain-containing protein n=1 Tax=Gossypium stocksii TaxID=47602 RepID=A0A9D3ZQL0_9ROSI|nr:hypothetical protein J1N35_034502 [Gossypium stocksii]